MVQIKFPMSILRPMANYLKKEEKKLEKRKKRVAQEDPFLRTDRVNENAAVDADAAEQTGHERVTAILLEINKALISVRKALSRIKLGRYGVCESCDEMIDTDRLAANPTAELCLKCAKKKT